MVALTLPAALSASLTSTLKQLEQLLPQKLTVADLPASASAVTATMMQNPVATALSAVAFFGVAGLVKNQWDTRHVRRTLKSLPKPAGSIPVFGHALELLRSCPWNTMMQWTRDNDNKPVTIDFMMQSGIVIADPDMLRRVLDTNQRNYVKDIEFSYKPFMPVLGNGLIASQGDLWKKQRLLLSAAFRIEILEETADVAKRSADRLSAKLEKLRGTGETIEMGEEFRILTLQVIGELVLSLTPEESERIFPRLYLPIVIEANLRIWYPWRYYMPTLSNWRYHQTLSQLNSYVEGIIRDRWLKRAQGVVQTRPDILDRVLEAVNPDDWCEAVVHQMRDEIKTFIFAGHETSASMLTWALFELTQTKSVRQTMLQEGRSIFETVVGTPNATQDKFQAAPMPTNAAIGKLEYTVCVLKEALRKYSLVPVVTRNAVDDDQLGDIRVPAGTKLFINIKAIHYNPKFWPEPTVFKPERFQAEYDPYTFLAFIQGPRNCLGQHLALIEARVVLSLLAQRFVFTPRDDQVGVPHDFTVPVCSRDGMYMTIN